jgi:cytochrome c oxidase subunit 2
MYFTHFEGEVMKRKRIRVSLFIAVLVMLAMHVRVACGETAPRRIEITASRFTFQPGEITLKKGQPVVLVLKSADVAHGLRFRELNVAVKVDAGGTTEVQFTPEKIGDFVGHCNVFCGGGHGSMAMKLHVVN